jgi:CheY-like chemotaxis protein
VDLSEVISKDAEFMRASVPKRVDLQFDLAPNLPCLEADPSQLEQILMNLVINAGEAIPPKTDGLIRVATRACEVTPELASRHSDNGVVAGCFVCLEVKDDGTGIDPSSLARIFDPFFSTKFTGRGLGLAAVHGIVRTAKGFIEVSSQPGSGTQFKVFLPASEKRPLATPARSVPLAQIRQSATILVVDDEEMVRKLACICLRRHGYEVLEASNGREALQVIAGASPLPSLVLLDLAMPVMGGDEVLPILEEKYPRLKILLSSGYPEEEARSGFPSGSIASFLKKPYTTVELADKVSQALEITG